MNISLLFIPTHCMERHLGLHTTTTSYILPLNVYVLSIMYGEDVVPPSDFSPCRRAESDWCGTTPSTAPWMKRETQTICHFPRSPGRATGLDVFKTTMKVWCKSTRPLKKRFLKHQEKNLHLESYLNLSETPRVWQSYFGNQCDETLHTIYADRFW